MRIVCFGDSITRGAELPEAQRWPQRLEDGLNQRRPGLYEVYNRGVGGQTSAQGFDRLEADVIPLLPAVVLVQFGFNDANVRDWARVPRVSLEEYARNLREFHRVVTARGGHCVLMVNHEVGTVAGWQGNAAPYRDNLAPYQRRVRSLAAELGAPIIDLPARMAERAITPEHMVAADGLHLTGMGSALYAAMVLEALWPVLEALGEPASGREDAVRMALP